jgi:hypothetical protein
MPHVEVCNGRSALSKDVCMLDVMSIVMPYEFVTFVEV